jgi:hypothetical protein
MNAAGNYYVYCYIDPRTGKEFYYGKGKGSRKEIHLWTQGKSRKAKKITRIRAAGKEPTIRVIAAALTEDQAFLVEAALIWKLGEVLTNENSGHHKTNFRPQNTLDKELEGFDFSHRSHFFNVGEHFDKGKWRVWEDCYKYGFLSTGYGARYKDQALQLRKGDVVLAYSSGHGYVGIGKVKVEACPARKFRIGKKSLKQMRLSASGMCHSYNNLNECEYVTRVKWLVRKKREEALPRNGHFYVQQTRASLEGQSKTRRYIEDKWGVKFEELLKQDER